MTNYFYYSLLKYTYSQVLGEVFNVGICFIFPEQSLVVFKYPSSFDRLRHLYHDFSTKTLKNYCKEFEKTAKSISNNQTLQNIQLINNPSELIRQEFLPYDASALRFSEVKTVIRYQNDIEKIIADYTENYLSHYLHKISPKRRDDDYLLSNFRKKLSQKQKGIENYLLGEQEISNDFTSHKFKCAWQNGSLNLVQAISFDLLESDSINQKSSLHYGKIHFLQSEAAKQNLRFDLLIGKSQQSNLLKPYEKAIKILKQLEKESSYTKIILEEDSEDYSNYLIREIHHKN